MAEVELWSYNGVKLPKLPEWAKDTYPNAYICKPSGYLHYYLTVTDKVGYFDENGWTYNAPDGVTMTHCQFVIAGSEEAVTELSETYPGISTTEWLMFVEGDYRRPYSGTILWANHDILYEDGSLYLAASKPNEIIDLKSWLYGFCLGICGKPLPLAAKKTPTAYSYNGVVLPKLPEWDREKYPYAVVVWLALGLCYLKCAKTPFYATGETITQDYYVDGETVYYEQPEVKCDSETIAFTATTTSTNPWELKDGISDEAGAFASIIAEFSLVGDRKSVV